MQALIAGNGTIEPRFTLAKSSEFKIVRCISHKRHKDTKGHLKPNHGWLYSFCLLCLFVPFVAKIRT